MVEIGNIYNVTIKRITELSYIIDYENEELFMHKNDAKDPLNVGDKVSVFFYADKNKRVCGTTYTPLISLKTVAILKVVSILEDLGLFLDIGIKKHILLDKRFLPKNTSLWPKVDEQLLVKMKGGNRLSLEPATIEKYKLDTYEVGDKKISFIQELHLNFVKVITPDLIPVTIFNSDIHQPPRLGEAVIVTIKKIGEQFIVGSLIANKEEQILVDSKRVLTILKSNPGLLFKSDENIDQIFNFFHMSKKAYKRAVGHLYSERVISIDENDDIRIIKEI